MAAATAANQQPIDRTVVTDDNIFYSKQNTPNTSHQLLITQPPTIPRILQRQNSNENWDNIYDLPKMEDVNKEVLSKLFAASAIALVFLLVEAAGGVISGSLAILSDAAHMFSDISGFLISIMSIWIGKRPASIQLSYGYHRAEVIGALASIALIWGLTIILLYEATTRIINKEAVGQPLFMLMTAAFGLVVNLVMAKVLHSAPGKKHDHDHGHDEDQHKEGSSHKDKHEQSSDHHHHNEKTKEENQNSPTKSQKGEALRRNKHHHSDNDEERQHNSNQHDKGVSSDDDQDEEEDQSKNISVMKAKDNYNLRVAMIHVLGDIIQSIGVLIAAILIYFFGGSKGYNYWHLADPLCTYLFSILVLITTFKVCKDCIRVLMEGTPKEIDSAEFLKQLLAIEYVVDIHDMHIWSLSQGKPAMTCHMFVTQRMDKALKKATRICRQHGIYHSTIQIEQWMQKGKSSYIKCDHNIHK